MADAIKVEKPAATEAAAKPPEKTPEEIAAEKLAAKQKFELDYTNKKREEYISANKKTAGFVFDERTWPKPVWSDTVVIPVPKNATPRRVMHTFPKAIPGGSPGSVFPRLVVLAVLIVVAIIFGTPYLTAL